MFYQSFLVPYYLGGGGALCLFSVALPTHYPYFLAYIIPCKNISYDIM